MPKALYMYGGWDGHQPDQCAQIVAPMLEASGVELTLSKDLQLYADVDRLRAYDVIVHNWSFDTITPEQEQGLLAAVESGVGIGGWHGGLLDSFRNNPTYSFMTGGQFVSHPGGQVTFEVNITDHQHPITAGLPNFSLHTEQYYMHMDPRCEVQAITTFKDPQQPGWIQGIIMPVVYTKPWGQGRVFACTIGHTAIDFNCAEFKEIVRRGILWAARPAA